MVIQRLGGPERGGTNARNGLIDLWYTTNGQQLSVLLSFFKAFEAKEGVC